MSKLKELYSNVSVRGLPPMLWSQSLACKRMARQHSNGATRLPAGKATNEPLYRRDKPHPEVVEQGRPCGLDGAHFAEETPGNEVGAAKDEVLEQALDANIIAELRVEIVSLPDGNMR